MTYDNILRLCDDPDVRDPIKYLREREIVHYQRFADANLPHSNRLTHVEKRIPKHGAAEHVALGFFILSVFSGIDKDIDILYDICSSRGMQNVKACTEIVQYAILFEQRHGFSTRKLFFGAVRLKAKNFKCKCFAHFTPPVKRDAPISPR